MIADFSKRFIKAARTELHCFNTKYLTNQKHPVINLTVKTNIVDVLAVLAYEYKDSNLMDLFQNEDLKLPLEAALRIFAIESSTQKHISPFLSSEVLCKEFFPKGFAEEAMERIKEITLDYKIHYCAGLTIGEGDNSFIFMKYDSPEMSRNNAFDLCKSIIEAIEDTTELKILEDIKNNHMDKFDKVAARSLVKAFEALYICKMIKEYDDKAFITLWHYRSFLSIMSTGIWAGVNKLINASSSTAHAARDAFISLYNEAHK